MESWAIALIAVGATIVGLYLLKVWIQVWARGAYTTLKMQHPQSHCDIDAFVNNHKTTNPVNAVKCVLSHHIQIGSSRKKLRGDSAIPLEFYESSHVPGLYVSQRRRGVDDGMDHATVKPKKGASTAAAAAAPTKTYAWNDLMSGNASSTNTSNKSPIVVCTIRMGFGHHRLAYSVSSWAMSTGRTTIFHDLLNIDSRTYFRWL